MLRKPADRLGKVVFANEVSIGGVGGGAWRGAQKNHRRLVIRVFFLQFLEGHVPLGNFVTVGSDFPGFDSPQVPQNGKKNNHKLGRAWLSSPLLRFFWITFSDFWTACHSQNAGEAVTPEMYTSIGRVTEFQYARQLAPNFLAYGKLRLLSWAVGLNDTWAVLNRRKARNARYLKTFGTSWGFLPDQSAVVPWLSPSPPASPVSAPGLHGQSRHPTWWGPTDLQKWSSLYLSQCPSEIWPER